MKIISGLVLIHDVLTAECVTGRKSNDDIIDYHDPHHHQGLMCYGLDLRESEHSLAKKPLADRVLGRRSIIFTLSREIIIGIIFVIIIIAIIIVIS